MSIPVPATLLWLAVSSTATAAPPPPLPWDPAASVPVANYRSAFEHYRPHADQPSAGWKDANDAARRAGGWRVYAREARRPESPSVEKPR